MQDKIFALFGIDRSILNTLFLRVTMASSNLGTILFVSVFLTPELQGYYYTFNSLIGLQVFVELGFNFTIVQVISHEMAKLSWNSVGCVEGDEKSKRRLQSLIHYIYHWFRITCPLIIILILPAGIYFFNRSSHNTVDIHTGLAWGLLVFATAYALLVNTALAVLEGCNKIAEVALVRITQNIGASVGICLALSAHLGLYALSIGSLLSGGLGTYILYTRYRVFYTDIWRLKSAGMGIDFKKEIWPFQWRIAVSWASGYLVFQIFNPLLFATHGPIAAGKMGMTLQVTGGLTSIASVWMSTKAPLFGRLIALGERSQLHTVFNRAVVQSTTLLITLCIGSITMLLVLQECYPNYSQRILPIGYFSMLCVIAVANHLNAAQACYLRASKEEPFMIVSLVNALVISSLSLLLIKPFGYIGAITAYGIGAIAINLGYGSIIFYKKYAIPRM
jgi:O-antigen/teichoic acid export membrane protein